MEVAGDELRTVIGDDSRMNVGELFSGSLQDHFDVGLAHTLAEFPMDEVMYQAEDPA